MFTLFGSKLAVSNRDPYTFIRFQRLDEWRGVFYIMRAAPESSDDPTYGAYPPLDNNGFPIDERFGRRSYVSYRVDWLARPINDGEFVPVQRELEYCSFLPIQCTAVISKYVSGRYRPLRELYYLATPQYPYDKDTSWILIMFPNRYDHCEEWHPYGDSHRLANIDDPQYRPAEGNPRSFVFIDQVLSDVEPQFADGSSILDIESVYPFNMAVYTPESAFTELYYCMDNHPDAADRLITENLISDYDYGLVFPKCECSYFIWHGIDTDLGLEIDDPVVDEDELYFIAIYSYFVYPTVASFMNMPVTQSWYESSVNSADSSLNVGYGVFAMNAPDAQYNPTGHTSVTTSWTQGGSNMMHPDWEPNTQIGHYLCTRIPAHCIMDGKSAIHLMGKAFQTASGSTYNSTTNLSGKSPLWGYNNVQVTGFLRSTVISAGTPFLNSFGIGENRGTTMPWMDTFPTGYTTTRGYGFASTGGGVTNTPNPGGLNGGSVRTNLYSLEYDNMGFSASTAASSWFVGLYRASDGELVTSIKIEPEPPPLDPLPDRPDNSDGYYDWYSMQLILHFSLVIGTNLIAKIDSQGSTTPVQTDRTETIYDFEWTHTLLEYERYKPESSNDGLPWEEFWNYTDAVLDHIILEGQNIIYDALLPTISVGVTRTYNTKQKVKIPFSRTIFGSANFSASLLCDIRLRVSGENNVPASSYVGPRYSFETVLTTGEAIGFIDESVNIINEGPVATKRINLRSLQ